MCIACRCIEPCGKSISARVDTCYLVYLDLYTTLMRRRDTHNNKAQKNIGITILIFAINFAISTMSKVPGAVYLQDTPISLQAASTPFLATDQKGSFA